MIIVVADAVALKDAYAQKKQSTALELSPEGGDRSKVGENLRKR